jgi:hypothetical protein
MDFINDVRCDIFNSSEFNIMRNPEKLGHLAAMLK